MAEQLKFERGNPLAFRATTQIHLGKIEKYIHEDDVVMFDGQTLDLGGETHVIPQLRGAVISGWLVPEADTTSTYVPKSADVKIRPAQAADITDRGEAMKVERADVEDRVVGTLDKAVEENAASAVNDDARSVGTIKTPAFQKTQVTSTTDLSREISKLDNTPPPKADFTKTATGDVTEAMAGDTLTEILPNAASSDTQTTKTTTKTTKKAKSRGRKGNEVVKLSTGGEWDMARHWRTRARDAVRTFANDPATLTAIKNVEVPSVVKFIDSKLD